MDKIYIDALRRRRPYDKVWRGGCRAVAGQERRRHGRRAHLRGNCVALRAVTSTDGMTADWSILPYEFLADVSNEIINKVRGVNRVVYDISSKPPATIEWASRLEIGQPASYYHFISVPNRFRRVLLARMTTTVTFLLSDYRIVAWYSNLMISAKSLFCWADILLNFVSTASYLLRRPTVIAPQNRHFRAYTARLRVINKHRPNVKPAALACAQHICWCISSQFRIKA